MLEFYAKYPQYAKHIIGESYAGHYMPAIGKAIVASNSIYAQNLKGMIAVGNGWVDPYIQYKAYSQYMYKQGLILTLMVCTMLVRFFLTLTSGQ